MSINCRLLNSFTRTNGQECKESVGNARTFLWLISQFVSILFNKHATCTKWLTGTEKPTIIAWMDVETTPRRFAARHFGTDVDWRFMHIYTRKGKSECKNLASMFQFSRRDFLQVFQHCHRFFFKLFSYQFCAHLSVQIVNMLLQQFRFWSDLN